MARRRKQTIEINDRWLISYSDMMTLLFALFVLLYTLNLDKQTTIPREELAGVLQESFSTPMEDIPLQRRIGPTEYTEGVFERFRGSQTEEPIRKNIEQINEKMSQAIDLDMKSVHQVIEDRLYGPEKYASKAAKGEERIVDIRRTQRGFAVEFMARDFYGEGEYDIRKDSKQKLISIAKALLELGRDITIEGHTDSTASGKLGNWELSSLRAAKLAQLFVDEAGYPASKIAIAGYGSMRPIAHNGTESGRRFNRRIEIHVNYDPSNSLVNPNKDD